MSQLSPNLSGADARAWLDRFAEAFTVEQERLTDLDRQSGDGDFGGNVRSALDKVAAQIASVDPQLPGEVFDAVSLGFLDTGGTSGPLFGMWFRALGRAQSGPVATTVSLCDGVRAGTQTVQRLGRAEVGDKTMVDALMPAADALDQAVRDGLDVTAALARAADAAEHGARSTVDLVARRGRASYVGEVARGVLDPGAATVALFFRAHRVD
jgi:dihydroxyacetone kinase-like protein